MTYFWNMHAVPVFVAAFLIAALGIKVTLAPTSAATRAFGWLCASTDTWLFFTAIGYLVRDDAALAAFWFRLDWVGVSFMSVCVYAFTCALLGLRRDRLLRIGYGIAAFFAILTLIANPLMNGVEKHSWGFFPRHDRFWSPVFLVFFFTYMALSMREYYLTYKTSQNPVQRNQIKYMAVAFAIAYLGSVDFMATFDVPVYPFGFLCIAAFVAISTYTIISHRLMDITIVARQTLVYSIVSGLLTSVYIGMLAIGAHVFEAWAGFRTLASSVLAFLVVNAIFTPLRRGIQNWVEHHFWRQSINKKVLYEVSSEFAHEIKMPLARISLPAELTLMDVREIQAGKKAPDGLWNKIEKRMQSILDQTALAAERVDAVRQIAAPLMNAEAKELITVSAWIQYSLESFRARIQQSHIQLDWQKNEAALKLYANLPQLDIALGNLIKNAIESVEANLADKERHLRLAFSKDGTHVELQIQDNGAGISPTDLPHIFKPHFTTKGRHGSGMGLHLTEQIIEGHHGSLRAYNSPQGGAIFCIRLPLSA